MMAKCGGPIAFATRREISSGLLPLSNRICRGSIGRCGLRRCARGVSLLSSLLLLNVCYKDRLPCSRS